MAAFGESLVPLGVQVYQEGAEESSSQLDKFKESAVGAAEGVEKLDAAQKKSNLGDYGSKADAAGKSTGTFGNALRSVLGIFGVHNEAVDSASAAQSGYAVAAGHSTSATHTLREALHAMHGVAFAAGVPMQNLGLFAGLARMGLAGLAITLTGGVVVALERTADAALSARSRLQDLVGVKAGAGIFDAMQGSAEKAKVSVDSMVSLIERAMRSAPQLTGFNPEQWVFPPGATDSMIQFTHAAQQSRTVITALTQAYQGNGQTASQAVKSIDQYLQAMLKVNEQTGKMTGLTAEIFQKMMEDSPALAKAIANAFGRPLPMDMLAGLQKVDISMRAFLDTMSRAAPAIDRMFQSRPRTITQSFEDLAVSAQKLFRAMGESSTARVATSAIQELSGAIERLADSEGGGERALTWMKTFATAAVAMFSPALAAVQGMVLFRSSATDLGSALGFTGEGLDTFRGAWDVAMVALAFAYNPFAGVIAAMVTFREETARVIQAIQNLLAWKASLQDFLIIAGGVAGAVAGFAVGGPVGAIAGGAAGLLGSAYLTGAVTSGQSSGGYEYTPPDLGDWSSYLSDTATFAPSGDNWVYPPEEGSYATGGKFVVPGSGGADSQLVRFYGTPGEKITITGPNTYDKQWSDQLEHFATGGATIAGKLPTRQASQFLNSPLVRAALGKSQYATASRALEMLGHPPSMAVGRASPYARGRHGYATGGSVPVEFMATPGEKISVEPEGPSLARFTASEILPGGRVLRRAFATGGAFQTDQSTLMQELEQIIANTGLVDAAQIPTTAMDIISMFGSALASAASDSPDTGEAVDFVPPSGFPLSQDIIDKIIAAVSGSGLASLKNASLRVALEAYLANRMAKSVMDIRGQKSTVQDALKRIAALQAAATALQTGPAAQPAGAASGATGAAAAASSFGGGGLNVRWPRGDNAQARLDKKSWDDYVKAWAEQEQKDKAAEAAREAARRGTGGGSGQGKPQPKKSPLRNVSDYLPNPATVLSRLQYQTLYDAAVQASYRPNIPISTTIGEPGFARIDVNQPSGYSLFEGGGYNSNVSLGGFPLVNYNTPSGYMPFMGGPPPTVSAANWAAYGALAGAYGLGTIGALAGAGGGWGFGAAPGALWGAGIGAGIGAWLGSGAARLVNWAAAPGAWTTTTTAYTPSRDVWSYGASPYQQIPTGYSPLSMYGGDVWAPSYFMPSGTVTTGYDFYSPAYDPYSSNVINWGEVPSYYLPDTGAFDFGTTPFETWGIDYGSYAGGDYSSYNYGYGNEYGYGASDYTSYGTGTSDYYNYSGPSYDYSSPSYSSYDMGDFQTGGSFTVPGSGGPDSQRISFNATPGEKVNIEPPSRRSVPEGKIIGQDRTIVINVFGAQNPESFILSTAQIRRELQRQLQ